MQAAIQRHVDAAVSKTINLPAEATVDAVSAVFLSAWRAKVKGITVYRYGSRAGQVLTLLADRDASLGPPVRVDTAFAGGLCRSRMRVLIAKVLGAQPARMGGSLPPNRDHSVNPMQPPDPVDDGTRRRELEDRRVAAGAADGSRRSRTRVKDHVAQESARDAIKFSELYAVGLRT